ncbi:hypothetical protein [Flectobacillus roseus]|uniref:hypothetical protein n=1 Tax=Flectobacillus roseus TaxID=502259 RepID=UPI0024B7C849|nr:hypothetical protein [Flectobacillus roseus]MDI9870569.1 hypothetical protein [Flectobacillus roseus]
MALEKFEVSGVTPGAFHFDGVEYNHETITDDIAKALVAKGYPYLKPKSDFGIAKEPQVIELPSVEKTPKK